jgi:hypothetical protein
MEEKRDQSLEFRIEGTEEEIQKMISEIERIVNKVAPKARLTITKE